jgi:hypothetical protein
LSFEENVEKEFYELGHASAFSVALGVDDSTPGGEAVSASEPYDISDYRDWYQPIALNRTSVIESPLGWMPYFSEPDVNDVVRQTSDHFSRYDDCVRAFGSIESSDLWNTKVQHKFKDRKSWVVRISKYT